MPKKKEKAESFKGQKVVCKLLKKWNSIVDDPKKKKQANKIFERIWQIKHGNIRPF